MDKTSVIIVVSAILIATILRIIYVKVIKPRETEQLTKIFTIVGFGLAFIFLVVLFWYVFFRR